MSPDKAAQVLDVIAQCKKAASRERRGHWDQLAVEILSHEPSPITLAHWLDLSPGARIEIAA